MAEAPSAARPRLLIVCVCAICCAQGSLAVETDPRTGLVIAEGWRLVDAHCGACHSHALVTEQRGDREFWTSTIRWMQRTQNLWQIPEAQERVLIDYLARHYNETEWGRRPPLPASLRPPEARSPARQEVLGALAGKISRAELRAAWLLPVG